MIFLPPFLPHYRESIAGGISSVRKLTQVTDYCLVIHQSTPSKSVFQNISRVAPCAGKPALSCSISYFLHSMPVAANKDVLPSGSSPM